MLPPSCRYHPTPVQPVPALRGCCADHGIFQAAGSPAAHPSLSPLVFGEAMIVPPHILPLSAIRTTGSSPDKRAFLAILALAIAVLLAWTPLASTWAGYRPRQRPQPLDHARARSGGGADGFNRAASSPCHCVHAFGRYRRRWKPRSYSAVIYSGGGIASAPLR